MKKCIVLNSLQLSRRKKCLLKNLFSEYLRILNLTLPELKNAKSSVELHHLTYHRIRSVSFLPSDLVQEARKDVWATRKTIKNGFSSCSIRFNNRWFRYVLTKREAPCFLITYSVGNRFTIPVKIDRQFERFQSFISDDWAFRNILLFSDGRVGVVLEKEFLTPKDEQRYVLGIDIGSSTLAAVSLFDTKTFKIVKQIYLGRDIAIKQREYSKRRSELQKLMAKGSKRAKKSFILLTHKQNDFVKTRSGQIAKEIIDIAISYGAAVVVEKLRGVRGKKYKFSKKSNQKISRIPYAKFREFLKSNCEIFGVPFYEVDAYNTSKWCPRCGTLNPGHSSGNFALYVCKECGLIVNSDRKASVAILIKSLLERNKIPFVKGHFQISRRRVPVNGLLRSNDVRKSFAVQHIS